MSEEDIPEEIESSKEYLLRQLNLIDATLHYHLRKLEYSEMMLRRLQEDILQIRLRKNECETELNVLYNGHIRQRQRQNRSFDQPPNSS